MKVHRKSDLIQYLDQNNLRAKKSLSQNFLVDGNVIEKILHVADVQKDDLILEVGPGPGALTELLIEKHPKLFAIEKDTSMAKALSERFDKSVLQVIEADILTWDIESFVKKEALGKKCKILSNLPYQITSPFLGRFLPLYPIVESLTLMVQKEVAERICAKPNTEHYSHLSVLCSLYATPYYCFDVSKNCFYPKPNVTSAVVQLKLHPPKISEHEKFLQLTRLLFQFRRKMIRSIVKKHGLEITDISLEPLLNRRAEELTLEDLFALFHGCSAKKQ